jgi:FMNH2-dependent dimethyl sulfone monooxygenase
VEVIAEKIADMKRAPRSRFGLPPMQFGMAAYAIVRDSEAEAEAELVADHHHPRPGRSSPPRASPISTSGCRAPSWSASSRSGIFGLQPRPAPQPCRHARAVRERIAEFEAAGLDLVLLQMSPQGEEMERFSAQVIRPGS